LSQINRLKTGDFSDSYFKSVKLGLQKDYILQFESQRTRMRLLAESFVSGVSLNDIFQYERKLESLTKDDIIDMAIQLAETGQITEEASILGGRIKFTMTSGKMEDSKEFVLIFEELKAKMQTTIDYSFNIYTVGLIVTKYNGVSTGSSVKERGLFMEKNIPMPVFRKILKTVNDFGRKVELMSHDEVIVFF